MGDFKRSPDIPKKYYRYFLKGLAYYTCHLNKACTMKDLQAFVYLKSMRSLSEADLSFLSREIMKQLVSTGVANTNNGYFRLNELLRFSSDTSSSPLLGQDLPGGDVSLGSGSGMKRNVRFSNKVTMWNEEAGDASDSIADVLDDAAQSVKSEEGSDSTDSENTVKNYSAEDTDSSEENSKIAGNEDEEDHDEDEDDDDD